MSESTSDSMFSSFSTSSMHSGSSGENLSLEEWDDLADLFEPSNVSNIKSNDKLEVKKVDCIHHNNKVKHEHGGSSSFAITLGDDAASQRPSSKSMIPDQSGSILPRKRPLNPPPPPMSSYHSHTVHNNNNNNNNDIIHNGNDSSTFPSCTQQGDAKKRLVYKETRGREARSVEMSIPSSQLDSALEKFAKTCLGQHAREEEVSQIKLRCWLGLWECSTDMLGLKRPKIEVNRNMSGVKLEWKNPGDEGTIVLGGNVITQGKTQKRSIDKRVRQCLKPVSPPYKSFVGTGLDCFLDTSTLHGGMESNN